MLLFLQRIYDAIVHVLTLLSGIPPLFNPVAKEHFSYVIETAATTTLADVQDATFGLAAIRSFETTIRTDVLTAIAALQTDVSGIISGADKVTPVTPPPAGYGGGGGGISAADVWNYLLVGGTITAGALVGDIPAEAIYERNTHVKPYYAAPDFWLVASNAAQTRVFPIALPIVDWANLRSTDTALSFLLREAPTFSWTTGLLDPQYISAFLAEGANAIIWIFRFNPAEFALMKASLLGQSIHIPPVWPGLAHVTLGAPTAISSSFSVAGPLDGVIVNLTSEPVRLPSYDFDGLASFRNLGSLTFLDDNGEAESHQNLGFTDAVYCPKFMNRAASAKFRTVGGLTGTVTPWTISL